MGEGDGLTDAVIVEPVVGVSAVVAFVVLDACADEITLEERDMMVDGSGDGRERSHVVWCEMFSMVESGWV